jgi:hypothetical protein
MGEREGAYRIWVGISEGRRLLGRPGHGLGDNIKMNVQEICWRGQGLVF